MRNNIVVDGGGHDDDLNGAIVISGASSSTYRYIGAKIQNNTVYKHAEAGIYIRVDDGGVAS